MANSRVRIEVGRRSRGATSGGQAEAVAHAADRLQVPPAEGQVDLAPQVAHVDVDHVGSAVVGEVPDVVHDVAAAQHLAGLAHEQLQEGELLGRQGDGLAGPVHLVVGGVEGEVADGQLDGAGAQVPPGQGPE